MDEMSNSAPPGAGGDLVTVRCLLIVGDQAELQVPGQDEFARWPAAAIGIDTGLERADIPGRVFRVHLSESPEHGRTFTGFELAG
jgi:hypothetical protein